MNRKVTVVGGAGNVGATVARGDRRQGARRRRHHRHRRPEGGGRRARHARGVPDRGLGRARDRRRRLRRQRPNSDIVVITSGVPRKPGMSRDDLLQRQLQDHAGGDRAGREVLAELHHRRRSPTRSTRCARRSTG